MGIMDEQYIILGELISKDLRLEDHEALLAHDDVPDLGSIHRKLSLLVAYLMEHDMHRLVNAMYRLDVSEAKFNEAMESESKEEAAIRVADLIIEREMQKVKTRLHYKKYRKF